MISKILKDLTFPLVVKPNQEGSTIGLYMVNNENELRDAISDDLKIIIEYLLKNLLKVKKLLLLF